MKHERSLRTQLTCECNNQASGFVYGRDLQTLNVTYSQYTCSSLGRTLHTSPVWHRLWVRNPIMPFLRALWSRLPKQTKQQIDVSFSCVCPVIDHKFRHHIVKVAVDPRGDSQVDPQTTLTM